MIHTSDGESFENEVHHVFGHDLMSDKQAPQAPTEPTGESSSNDGYIPGRKPGPGYFNKDRPDDPGTDPIGEEIDRQGQQHHIDRLLDPTNNQRSAAWTLLGKVPVGELSSEPSKNIEHRTSRRTTPTREELQDVVEKHDERNRNRLNNYASEMSADLGLQDITKREAGLK